MRRWGCSRFRPPPRRISWSTGSSARAKRSPTRTPSPPGFENEKHNCGASTISRLRCSTPPDVGLRPALTVLHSLSLMHVVPSSDVVMVVMQNIDEAAAALAGPGPGRQHIAGGHDRVLLHPPQARQRPGATHAAARWPTPPARAPFCLLRVLTPTIILCVKALDHRVRPLWHRRLRRPSSALELRLMTHATRLQL